MEIRTLRYFLAVAREENMTRAAEQLHLTQPTLSKALKFVVFPLTKRYHRKAYLENYFSSGIESCSVFVYNDPITCTPYRRDQLCRAQRKIICA